MSELKKLIDAVQGFDANSCAILYSPKKCRLALFDGAKFVNQESEEIDLSDVFEARVFNPEKELRWLNEANGAGKSAIISDAAFPEAINRIEQTYLLWGKKNAQAGGGWTQFAEARIGTYYVPKEISTEFAQFTAVEYLGELADGNVAVIDERLKEISEVK